MFFSRAEASLPSLKHLKFIAPIKDPNFFSKIGSFRNLTSMLIFPLGPLQFSQILELIGTQLSYLFLSSGKVEDDLYFKIFHLCPNLVKVDLTIDTIENPPISKYKELVSDKNFLRLEEFKCGYSDNECFTLPAGFFSLVLQAPLLRIVDVEFWSVTKEDCVWLRDVEEGRFQRLEKVSLWSLNLADGCEMDNFGQMLKFLVCGAPNLKRIEMNFDLRFDPDYFDDWNVGQAGVIKCVELLDSYSVRRDFFG